MNFDITIWLGMALSISMVVNIFLFWYLRKILARLMFVSENLSDLVEIIKNYSKHLKQVYGMDLFYGDETLKFLMSHTSSLLEILKDYEDIYTIAIPLEPQEEINFDEQTTTEEEDEPQVAEENVFYAGSRNRNS